MVPEISRPFADYETRADTQPFRRSSSAGGESRLGVALSDLNSTCDMCQARVQPHELIVLRLRFRPSAPTRSRTIGLPLSMPTKGASPTASEVERFRRRASVRGRSRPLVTRTATQS